MQQILAGKQAGRRAKLQYPGVQPHPLPTGALSLGLGCLAQQAQRRPEVSPAVIPVPCLIGAPGRRAAESLARLGAAGREHHRRGRRRAALSAGRHRLRLDADVGVGGDREGSAHVGQRAARAKAQGTGRRKRRDRQTDREGGQMEEGADKCTDRVGGEKARKEKGEKEGQKSGKRRETRYFSLCS